MLTPPFCVRIPEYEYQVSQLQASGHAVRAVPLSAVVDLHGLVNAEADDDLRGSVHGFSPECNDIFTANFNNFDVPEIINLALSWK